MTIATELRLQVYQSLFNNLELVKPALYLAGNAFRYLFEAEKEVAGRQPSNCTNLLSVCRFLYNEILPILYSSATFQYLGIGSFLGQFRNGRTRGARTLDPKAVKAMQRVVIRTDVRGILADPHAYLPSLKHLTIHVDDDSTYSGKFRVGASEVDGLVEVAREVFRTPRGNLAALEVEIIKPLLERGGVPRLVRDFMASHQRVRSTQSRIALIYKLELKPRWWNLLSTSQGKCYVISSLPLPFQALRVT